MNVFDDIKAWFEGVQAVILGDAQFAPLRHLFPTRAEAFHDLVMANNLHQRAIKIIDQTFDTTAQSLIIRAIDTYLRRGLFLPSVGHDGLDVDGVAGAMNRDGCAVLPAIDAARTGEMRTYFADKPVAPGREVAGEELCDIDAARTKGSFARFPTSVVFGCPHLLAIASDPAVIAIVERHLGTVPTIAGLSAWWSYSNGRPAEEAQLFHGDIEDYRFCKLFIYLTDVDMDSGPHAFMPTTHDLGTVGGVRQGWPGGSDEFDAWYFGQFWKSDDDTRRYFGRDPTYFTGPEGFAFMANTRGLHKGQTPEKTDRLVCQILYGVMPRLLEKLSPVAVGSPAAAHLPPSIGKRPFAYVNRLYVG